MERPRPRQVCAGLQVETADPSLQRMEGVLLEINVVMSSLLFMIITYYSVVTDANEHDSHSLGYV